MKLMHKPLGVALTTLFCAFWGVLLVPIGYVTSMAKGVHGAPRYAGLYGALCLALGISMLASAYGLWRMQAWGRTLAIRIVLATLPISMLGLTGMLSAGKVSAGSAISCLLGIALTFGIVRYLGRSDVRRLYERSDLPPRLEVARTAGVNE